MVKGNRPVTPIRPRRPVVIDRPGDPGSECAVERSLEFVPEPGAAPGQSVHLVPGRKWWGLVAGNSKVGRVAADAVPADLSACVKDGWAFAGTVPKVGKDSGIALISGHPTR